MKKTAFSVLFVTSSIFITAQKSLDTLIVFVNEQVKDLPNNLQLSIAVVKKDTTLFYGFKKENDSIIEIENRLNTFELGSITKVFTSLVLANAQKKEWTLETTVDELLGFDLNNDQKITLKSLANHSSGLSRLPENIFPAMMKDMNNPYANYSQEEFIHYLQNELQINDEVKGSYSYSNTGAALLAYALSNGDSNIFYDQLKSIILDSAKMKSTSFNSSNTYKIAGIDSYGKQVTNWDFGVMFGAGGLYSNTLDMSNFILKCLDPENQLFSLTSTTTLEVNENMSLGLAWHIIHQDELNIFFHNGGTGGYTSALSICPQENTGVIVLSNSSALNPNSKVIDELCFSILKSSIDQ